MISLLYSRRGYLFVSFLAFNYVGTDPVEYISEWLFEQLTTAVYMLIFTRSFCLHYIILFVLFIRLGFLTLSRASFRWMPPHGHSLGLWLKHLMKVQGYL